jgi:hypothetical protein
MIKSVAQVLPTYTMSTFEVPKKICENLDAVTRRFWWNPKTPSGRFLAWKSWDALCLPKKDGGLGFRKNKNFNKALLAKLAWMVVSNRNSICMKLVRSKYKVRGDWLFKDPVKNSSPPWRAIEKTKKLITKVHVSLWEMELLSMFGRILGFLGFKTSKQGQRMTMTNNFL